MGLACPLTVMWLEQCEQKGRGRRRLQPPLARQGPIAGVQSDGNGWPGGGPV